MEIKRTEIELVGGYAKTTTSKPNLLQMKLELEKFIEEIIVELEIYLLMV